MSTIAFRRSRRIVALVAAISSIHALYFVQHAWNDRAVVQGKTHQLETELAYDQRKLLSHEVRGGLAAVITTAEDLLDVVRTALDPASVEQLESIGRRCWSLSALLGEMLASAKAGGPTWVDTAQIFESLVTRFGRPSRRTATVWFRVAGRTPAEVAEHLAGRRVNVWHGHNYAWELAGALGIRDSGSAVRAGLVHYNDRSDVDRLLAALAELA